MRCGIEDRNYNIGSGEGRGYFFDNEMDSNYVWGYEKDNYGASGNCRNVMPEVFYE